MRKKKTISAKSAVVLTSTLFFFSS